MQQCSFQNSERENGVIDGLAEEETESSREKRWQMGTWGEACNAHVIAAWLHGLGTRSFSFGLLSGSKARLFSENKLKYPRPDQTPSGPMKNQGSVSTARTNQKQGARRRRRHKQAAQKGFETWQPSIHPGIIYQARGTTPTAGRRSEIN